MARNNNINPPRRRTRKEFLLTRKQQEQYRQIRLIVFGLVGLLALVLGTGLVYEYVVKPGQPVAEVNGTQISVADWQQRVRFERAQTIEQIDGLYTALGGDVNQLTQFAGTQLQLLLAPEFLGERVLNQMIDEQLVLQQAQALGVVATDAEIDQAIEERFSFFDGALPTATPEPTQTPVPTPSVTPIGFELTPTAEAAEPTAVPEEIPPAPTATPVTADGFQELLAEELTRFDDLGLSEAGYRALTAFQLNIEALGNAFAEDSPLTTEEEQVSLFYLSYATEAEAQATLQSISSGEKPFLTAWNEIRSTERISATQPFASELQWTAVDGISTTFGLEASQVVRTLPIDTPSDVLAGPNDRFLLLNLRGREMRPLSEQALEQQKQDLVTAWLDEVRGDAIIYPRWEDNVPDRPILDPKYYTQQTAPTVEPVIVTTPSP